LDHGPLRANVWELLRADWSPEQIAHSLPVLFPTDARMRVSHETMRELTAHLRTGRQRRKPQTGGARRVTLGITEDLLMGGTGKGAVITLVERSSWFVLLAPLPGRHTAEIARMTLAEMIATRPLELRKSITWDGGSEMAQHARFKTATGLQIYFCDPQAPVATAV
jgi:IS30 family transposase